MSGFDDRYDDEMAFHIEMAIQKNIRAGMSPEEARRQALVAYGGRDQFREAGRDEVRSRYWDELKQDIRYAVRGLRRAPAFTTAAIATLALSIGATSAIFSVVNAALLESLPYPSAERIVAVCEKSTVRPEQNVCPVGGFAVANYAIWRETATSFDALAAFREGRVAVIAPTAEPVSAQARLTSASLFTVVGAQPQLGRFFTADEDRPGGPNVMVVSHSFWQQYLSGVQDVVGSRVRVNSNDYTIVGVTGPGFSVYDPVDVWLPMRIGEAHKSQPGRSLRALALLKPGVTVDQANRELQLLAARRAADEPQYNTNMTAYALPLRDKLVGNADRVLWTLLAAVGFLLLIGCANVANLLLARAADREREIAVRVSLGASPRRLVRQLLTESLVLAVTASGLAMVLAWKGTQALIALVPSDMPLQLLVHGGVDWRVVAFTAAVALTCGVLFGLVPAMQAARAQVHDSLKEGGRGGTDQSRASARVRSALVVAEMSLALVLLAGAGLMVRSFAALRQVNLGFQPEHALTARVALPGARYGSDTAVAAFFDQAEAKIAALPGVRSVGAISYLPLTGQRSVTGFNVAGRPPARPGEEPSGDIRAVTPGYFRAMGIPLMEGRGLAPTDGIGSPMVGVVSETLARTLFPGESAVGKVLVYDWDAEQRVEIVGVVGDVHHDGPDRQAYMEIYRPLTQLAYGSMAMVVRVSGDPASYVRPMAAAIREVDSDIPLASAQPVMDLVSRAVGSARLSTTLFVLFGVLGLLLAAIGIYGVMSYTVQQRQHEMRVRLALGASPRQVTRLMVKRGAVLALAGIGIGLVLALGGAGLMRKLLFGVPPHDGVTFVAIAAILASVGIAAAYVPARRAARIQPAGVLRGD